MAPGSLKRVRSVSLTIAACLVGACGPGVVEGHPDARDDGGSVSDTALDTMTDAGQGTDGSMGLDASDAPADVASNDVSVPPIDSPPPCTPTRTTCNMALECGAIPNGCPGGVVDCVACGGGETWCQTLAAPRWRSRVNTCVSSVSSANPTWFDPSVTCSTGFTHVVPAYAMDFVRAVAACADGSGALAIVDPNAPSNEIRVRGTDDDVADNYSVILYGSGCSSARYTSSCTPSFF